MFSTETFSSMPINAAEARGIEHSCHADNASLREIAHAVRGLDHRIQWIADDNDDAVRRVLHDLLGDALDDVVVRLQEIVAAHAGLARNACRDHHDVRICRVPVFVRARYAGVVAFNGCGLCQIQSLALRDPGNDIHQDNVSELLVHNALGCSRTNVARANNRYLASCHSLSLKTSMKSLNSAST